MTWLRVLRFAAMFATGFLAGGLWHRWNIYAVAACASVSFFCWGYLFSAWTTAHVLLDKGLASEFLRRRDPAS